MHVKTKYLNPALVTELGGYGAAHDNTTARVTLRGNKEKHIQQPKHDVGMAYILKKGNMEAVTTMRQYTQDNKYTQPLLHKKLGAYGAAQDGTFAPTTIKQLTIDNKYLGTLGGKDKDRPREDVDNAYLNVNKEKIALGRYPTLSNYSKGPTFDYTKMRVNNPVQLNRVLVGNKFGYDKSRLIPKVRIPGILKHNLDRNINEYLKDTLKNNPYVNNSQHKSIKMDDN